MATVMNDRDNLLLNATQRTINPLTATILLTSDSPTFHVSSGGTTSPLQITVTAHLIGITGTASFTATGATITDNGDNTATIDYASVTSSTITVNASVTSNGQTFNTTTTISKVMDGADGTGTTGPAGDRYAIAYLYKWSTVDVANPTGSSTFDWASGVNTIYSGTDNWSVTPPNNPGDPGIRLYVASVSVTAAGGTSTSTVFYNSATVQYWSSNGQNGQPGAPGIKSFTVKAFQWSNGPAPTATGTATFTWNGTSYDNVPSGSPSNWSKTKPTAPGPGFTLYEADVNIVETAGAATSPIDWTTANVVGTSYMGVDGSGSTGASSMIAYTLVDGFTLASTPSSVTLDGHPLPTTGTWGETRAWTSQPTLPAAGQSIFQSNGTYDPNTNQVTWGLPYLSSLRVGALSSLTENTGDLTFTGTAQSANGKIQLHADGSASFRQVEIIDDATGNIVLDAGGLKQDYAAPGTLNSELTPAINLASGVSLVGRNGWVEVDGNVLTKVGNTNTAYDADAYSKNGYEGGAYASVLAPTTDIRVFFGLSTQPLWDAGYDRIDYSVLFELGHFYAYSGNTQLTFDTPTFSTDDIFEILYDGTTVKWMRNGVVWFSQAAAITAPLFFDSSFYTMGGQLKGVRFGPMSSNNWSSVGGTGKPQDNATVGATWGGNISGQPKDISNLVLISSFEDVTNGWSDSWGNAVEAVVGSNAPNVPYTKSLTTHGRDTVNGNNQIPLTPDETIYFAAWMQTATTPYNQSFGLQVHAADGTRLGWIGGCALNARLDWTYVTGSFVVPATYEGGVIAFGYPWLQQDGFDFSNDGYGHFVGMWIGRHAPGATVGAPAGTNVGSTPAQTVESNAAAGKSASDAIPGIDSAIADKLSKTSPSSLAATVTLTTGGSILSGDTTNGTYQSPSGFYGVQGGVVKFSVPISGDPTFAGQLTAAYGTFGGVSIAAGGSFALQATSYNNDQGVWFGYVSGVPKFSIVASNGAKLLFDPTQTNALQIINATVSGANKPSVTLTNHASGNYANGTTSYGGITLTVTNGTAPFSVSWACNDSGNVNKLGISSSDNTGASIKSVSGSTTNSTGTATVSVTVVDANGIAATGSVLVNITCGTGA